MEKPYWFGVAVQFPCVACGKVSVEKYGVNAPSDDMDRLRAEINKQPLYCRLCLTPLADGTEVQVAIRSGTRQSLFLENYEVPEMPGDR